LQTTEEQLRSTEEQLTKAKAQATQYRIENKYLLEDVTKQDIILSHIPFESIGERQKKRRIDDAKVVIDWLQQILSIDEQALLKILPKRTADLETTQSDETTVIELTAKSSSIPRINQLKTARKSLNKQISEELRVENKGGSVQLDPEKVYLKMNSKTPSTTIKISFDHRKNEGRNEILVGLIPVVDNLQHSPISVYPIALYYGKEEDIHNLSNDFHAVNKFIDQHPEEVLCIC